MTPYGSRTHLGLLWKHVQQSVHSVTQSRKWRGSTNAWNNATMQPPSLWIQAKPKEFSKYNKLQRGKNILHLWTSSLSNDSPHFIASSGVGLQIKAERFFSKPISVRFLIVWPIRSCALLSLEYVCLCECLSKSLLDGLFYISLCEEEGVGSGCTNRMACSAHSSSQRLILAFIVCLRSALTLPLTLPNKGTLSNRGVLFQIKS